MLVLDASVVIELLVSNDQKKIFRLEERLREETLLSPDHMWLEVVGVISRLARSRVLSDVDAYRAVIQLQRLNIKSVSASSFVDRVWKLRNNVYSRDAGYVAVAETFSAPLLTCDKKLSKAKGPECEFELW